jgi:hypothetical protein
MKNCFELLILIAVLFAAQTKDLSASETRVFSMGQVGLFTHDNSNVTPFPGLIMNYGNEVVTELRFKDLEPSFSAEVRIPVNSYMIGVNFNRPIFLMTPPVGQSFVRLTNTSDLYFGTELMGHNAAFRISLGRDGYKQDSIAAIFQPQLDESARYLEIAAGFSSDYYDVSISLEFPSIKSESVTLPPDSIETLKDEWSGTGINLIGRYFYELNKKMQAVPVVRFGTASTTQKTDQPGTLPQLQTDFSTFTFNLGIGLHYQLNKDNLIILAMDPFGVNKLTTDYKDVGKVTQTTTILPRMYLGVEGKIKKRLVGRIGAIRSYQTVKTETKPTQGAGTETSFQTSPYNVTFGLGLRIGKFLIDLDINDGMFFEGPNFISGQLRDLANRVSISYLFSNSEKE